MTHGSLFAGIGGFDLAAECAGIKTIWQVEINPYCQRVLKKNFPEAKRYGDIRDVGKHNLERVDIISGGFPCQPFSIAGKQKGKTDDRFLWPEMFRVIREMRPSFVICENVTGIIDLALDQVLIDLENKGYVGETFIIPACAVNAPHKRDRVWIIAYSKNTDFNWDDESRIFTYSDSIRRHRRGEIDYLKIQNKQKWNKMDCKTEGYGEKRTVADSDGKRCENSSWLYSR